MQDRTLPGLVTVSGNGSKKSVWTRTQLTGGEDQRILKDLRRTGKAYNFLITLS
ncbi:hypothetical protein [Sphingobacterium mizutaii]|uniref:hypothetical protein n=1 Tax=Sphingobacterium mizutaii TaxID=1010 RepID=UPI001625C949|nr:hypothetical protein [Sphingobacterium mizutaii]